MAASGPAVGKRVMSRVPRTFALALALLAAPATVHADDTSSPKRKVPDYDGRGRKPTNASDVLLWIPRVLFSPVYFTTEYLIRRPLGGLLTWAERVNAFQSFYDFFVFGPDHRAGFAPIGFFDFGFNPSVGVYVFWDDALKRGNDLAFHGTTWGTDWLAGVWTDRVHFGKRGNTFTFNAVAIKRPDHAFFGVGPDALESDLGRYGEEMVDVSGAFDLKPARPLEVRATGGIRDANFYAGHYGTDPSIEAESQTGAYPLPDGFAKGYTSVYEHLSFAVDSRKARPVSGSGVRLELDGENAGDVRSGSGWVRYGGTFGGFWDITGTGRILSLSFATAFADPLGKNPVPFTELVALGGDGPMRGYIPGRLLGRSYAALTVRYRWPIWMWLDGSLQAAVGNVFDEHLEGFKPSLLRLSGALGIESTFSLDTSIELLVGFGTETFDHGATVNSVRFLVGSNRGF